MDVQSQGASRKVVVRPPATLGENSVGSNDTTGSTVSEQLLLVNMPFGAINFPSIQLGLLQALSQSAEIPCKSIYANLAFAKRIEPQIYNVLSNHRGVMVGEWLFAAAAFADAVDNGDEFLLTFADAFSDIEQKTGASPNHLRYLRDVTAPAFITELANDIVAANPVVVGLTSTFEQNLASIALARAIKARAPNIVTLFGGANFDGSMGVAYMEAIPWIDACVVGEADQVFVPLVKTYLEGSEAPRMEGVLTRGRLGEIEAVGRASYAAQMDDLPMPVYDDYFEAVARYQLTDNDLGRAIVLPIESSRGCWWGEKHHCTFCGLNALGMAFRAKSAGKVLGEIAQLSDRYKINRFAAVDNILSPKLMEGLTQELAGGEYDYSLFYEIKANLSREKIQRLYNSGIRQVQPGIESLSTHVLKLMRKGITAIQNVNTLRWLNYYGIEVFWNVIYGFPGETDADYERQLQIISQIQHLAPPNYLGPIWLERFSPLYREVAAAEELRPERSYSYIYPANVDLSRASYFFEWRSHQAVSEPVIKQLRAGVDRWQSKWAMDRLPSLTFVRTHGNIHISDGREQPHAPISISYRAPADSIYIYCSEQPRSLDNIVQFLRSSCGVTLGQGNLEAILERFVARGFMLAEDNLYLSLALPSYRRA
jgi:ribosomal peptide maturation radical SAM protein 1